MKGSLCLFIKGIFRFEGVRMSQSFPQATLEELKQDFSLSDAEARKVLEKYWNDERK